MAYNYFGAEIDPGAYDVDYLKIIGDEGEVDVTYLLIELNIIENIFAKCITGSIVLQDSLNIITNLPVREGDLIEGRLKTIDTDPYVSMFDPDGEIEFTFEIIKISHQEKIKQDTQVWSASFVSSTWTDNLANRISRSWKQVQYNTIIEDIFMDYLSHQGLKKKLPIKPLDAKPTEGLWNVVIPNWKPYDAITWISRRSFDGIAVNFLFYEDKEQFYYISMNEILGKGPVEEYFTSSADRFVSDGMSDEPNPEYLRPRYLNIATMKFLGYHDITKAAAKGMIGNRMIRWDPFYKRVTDFYPHGPEAPNYTLDEPYNYIDDFEALNHCEKLRELIRDEVSAKFSTEEANAVLTVVPDHNHCWEDQETFETEKYVRQRSGQIEQLEFLALEVTMPGNFTRRVGEKIEIDFNSPEFKFKGPDETPVPDVRFRGNWLIATLRRKFTSDRHTLVCELIKDNYHTLRINPIWEDMLPPGSDPQAEIKYDGHGKVRGL